MIFERFREVALRAQDDCAVVVDGDEYTYRELLDRVEACAARLQRAGCGAGDSVVLLFPNGVDFVVVSFAVWAVRGALVPLNEAFTRDEIEHCMAECRPRVVFHRAGLETITPDSADPTLYWTTTVDRADESGAGKFEAPAPAADPDISALRMFSSGSTGKAKRISRSQAQVLCEYDALAKTAGLTADERVLCVVPLYHAHGFCNGMMAALMSGGRLILRTAEFNARATVRAIEKNEVTLFPSVPFMYQTMAGTRFAEPPTLRSVRLAISAGAPLSPEVAQRFHDAFGIPISQLYGTTETGAICLNHDRPLERPESVGRPLSGFEVLILDDIGNERDPGEEGEIWVRTGSMTSQYDGLATMTDSCFQSGAFFTGDLGYLDGEGFLHIVGRMKQIINVAGRKVDPVEVDQVVMDHPEVVEAVTVGVAHPDYGEMVKVAVVCSEGSSLTERDVTDHVSQHLADYKVPKVVVFLDEIPRSPLGKVLRKYL